MGFDRLFAFLMFAFFALPVVKLLFLAPVLWYYSSLFVSFGVFPDGFALWMICLYFWPGFCRIF